MKQTNAAAKVQSPSGSNSDTKKQATGDKNPTAAFVGMALDMSWRLAIVVVLPVVAGFKLDSHFDTSPFLSLLGLALALAGTVIVLKQTLRAANESTKDIKFTPQGKHINDEDDEW
ncbi:MAG: hypothetical protein QFB86_00315 [Patescibacteria group bacterium]|nr:hypothetical protein [Patescibacteria group bacterium]